MSEQTGANGPTEEDNEQNENTQFEHITSQEEFDARIQSRLARATNKFADYDQLKADAAELAALKEAQLTDEQRRQAQDAERDRELAELRTDKLRREIAAEKSDAAKGIVVPAELLSGTTREALEASADALLKFKGDGQQQRPRVVVTTEGERRTNAGLSDADHDLVGQLFRNND